MPRSFLRRRFLTAVSAFTLVGPSTLSRAFAADPQPVEPKSTEAAKTDRQILQGIWLVARVGTNGAEKKPAEGDSITLTVENETFKAVVVRDGDTLDVVGSFSVVETETPKLLDLVVQNGDKAMAVYCLYELEKNVFKVRFNAATGERVPDFTTQVEGGTTLVFHRKREDQKLETGN